MLLFNVFCDWSNLENTKDYGMLKGTLKDAAVKLADAM